MTQQDREPPFIAGLNNARKILVELRAKKVKEQEIDRIAQTPVKEQEQDIQALPSQFSKSEKAKESLSPPSYKERTFILHNKINEIGRELFECHKECENYQSIFNNLAEYYADNLPTIELNEKLKKKSYELQEITSEYQKKIKTNQQEINQAKKYEQQAKKIVKEHLWNYLVEEADKSEEVPHQKVKLRHNMKTNGQVVKQEKEPPKAHLELKFAALKKQVARKPMMKKSTLEQEQLRRPFYSSQLYSL